MPPEESGRFLLDRMRTRIGLANYENVRLLDFGCGVRFTQTILNTDMKIGSYVGVDNYSDMIEFLNESVRDQRFRFLYLNAYHPLYNTSGERLSSNTTLPLDEGSFDIVSMFSVITHQGPDDSHMIFRLLRRYVKADGHLFFTCFLDPLLESHEDRSPLKNGGMCFYGPSFLERIVETSGWRIVNHAPGEGPLIADSYLCQPA